MLYSEALSKHVACVYRFKFPDGKYYVGQTKDLSERLRLYECQLSGSFGDTKSCVMSALTLFGLKNVDIDILCTVSTDDKACLPLCLSILEIKFIRDNDCLYPRGYNISEGGELLGINHDSINTDGNHKAVLLYDSSGNFYKEFPTIARCAYFLGVKEKEVSKCINRRNSLFLNTYFIREKRYDEIPKKIISLKPKRVVKTIVTKKYIEKECINYTTPHALKYDSLGNFCGEYKSKNDAIKSIGGKTYIPYGKYYKGFVLYKKVSDNFPKKIEPYEATIGKFLEDVYKPMSECQDIDVCSSSNPLSKAYKKKDKLKNDFPINQYSLSGEFIASYSGIRDASKSTGILYSSIWSCVLGRTKKAGGYRWEKVSGVG